MLYAFFGNYLIPMIIMIFFYVHIVKAVVMHEAALKAQAKKMNVESLRSNVSCLSTFESAVCLHLVSLGQRRRECRSKNCQSGHYQLPTLGSCLDPLCSCGYDWLFW